MTKRTQVLKRGEIIPLTYDFVFNKIFANEKNINILENFISNILNLNIEEVRGSLHIKPRNLELNNKSERNKQIDLLLEYHGDLINIELNNNSGEGIKERNLVYACSVHASQLEYGDNSYKKINKTIQINLNTKPNSTGLLIDKYNLKNEYNKTYSDKLVIYMIDISLGVDMCYNGTSDKLAKWCYVLTSQTEDELGKYLGDIMNEKEQNQLVDEMSKLSSNEKVIALYSAYSREELERNTLIIEAEEKGIEKGIEQGIEKGRQEGIEQGREEEKEEMIRKLYEKGLPIKEISEIVNKTEEEIEIILNR